MKKPYPQRKTVEPIERFLKLLDKQGEDECWPWKGQFTTYGAGKFTIEHTIEGKRKVSTYFANRFSYEYFTGKTVSTRYLDNICENRWCCNPKHMRPRNFDARLWDNTDRTQGECWLWKGHVHPVTGYGAITIDHISILVHRVAYETYYNEKVPEGLFVLHSCDTRRCINPAHLRIGTHLDNMKDMVKSGHSQRGEKNNNTILTEAQVVEIKIHLFTHDLSQSKIAEKFGVSCSTIKDIASGRCWGWVSIEASSSSCA